MLGRSLLNSQTISPRFFVLPLMRSTPGTDRPVSSLCTTSMPSSKRAEYRTCRRPSLWFSTRLLSTALTFGDLAASCGNGLLLIVTSCEFAELKLGFLTSYIVSPISIVNLADRLEVYLRNCSIDMGHDTSSFGTYTFSAYVARVFSGSKYRIRPLSGCSALTRIILLSDSISTATLFQNGVPERYTRRSQLRATCSSSRNVSGAFASCMTLR